MSNPRTEEGKMKYEILPNLGQKGRQISLSVEWSSLVLNTPSPLHGHVLTIPISPNRAGTTLPILRGLTTLPVHLVYRRAE